MRIRDLPDWFRTGGLVKHKEYGVCFVKHMIEFWNNDYITVAIGTEESRLKTFKQPVYLISETIDVNSDTLNDFSEHKPDKKPCNDLIDAMIQHICLYCMQPLRTLCCQEPHNTNLFQCHRECGNMSCPHLIERGEVYKTEKMPAMMIY